MCALGPWFFACWWEILLSFFWSRNFFSIFASESRHFVFSSIFAQKSTSNRFLGSYVCSRTVIFCLLVGNFIIFLLKQKLFSRERFLLLRAAILFFPHMSSLKFIYREVVVNLEVWFFVVCPEYFRYLLSKSEIIF